MKKIEIFGKKVPLFAILIAVLVIGTASAAIFMNYATLTGEIDVTHSISVSDYDTDPIALGGDGELIFASPATFVVNNNGDEPVIVDLVTTLFLDSVEVTDETGLAVDYSVINGSDVEEGMVLIPPGGLTINVEFDAVDNAIPGTYTVQVEVNYSATPYDEFEGDNAMVDVTLTHKDGEPDWNPIGNNSSLSYAPMGNEFYFELDAIELEASISHSLIYYADPWPGNNPGAVMAAFTTDGNGDVTSSGHVDLGMNIPHADDDNFDEGAKVWVVLSSNLTNGNAMPMIGYDHTKYLTEYSEILDEDYTDLVKYEDTDA